MKHKIKKRTLGRSSSHRRAMRKNLVSSLLEHGYLVTTRAKAKDLVIQMDGLLRQSKGESSLHLRRNLISKLGKKEDFERLMAMGKELNDRSSGYLRLTKMPNTRSDGAEMVKVEPVNTSKP